MGRRKKPTVEKKKRVRAQRQTKFSKKQKQSFLYGEDREQYKKAAKGSHYNVKGSLLNISAGPRYVYFSTLYSEPEEIYKQLAAEGQGLVSSAAAALTMGAQDSSSTQEQIQKIKKYVDLIGQAAENQRSLEASFLDKVRKTTQKSKLKTIIEHYQKYIDPNHPESFNYKTFIVLLNQAHGQLDGLTKKRRQILMQNAELIEENIKAHGEDGDKIREQLYAAMQEGYGSYLKKIREYDLLLTQRQGEKIIKSFRSGMHEQLAKALNTLMRQLSKNKQISTHIEAMVISSLTAQGKTFLSQQEIADQIIATAIDWIMSKEGNTDNWTYSLIENFQAEYQAGLIGKKIYSEDQIKKITEIVNKSNQKSLEELALITKRGVGQLFAQLDHYTQTLVMRKYGAIDDKKNKDENALRLQQLRKIYTSSSASDSAKEKAIRQTGKIVQKMISDKFTKFQDLALEERKKLFQTYKKKVKNFITPINYKKKFEQNFKIKFNASAVSQRIQGELINKIAKSFGNHKATVMGNKVKMKTDIGFTYQFEMPDDLGEHSILSGLGQELSNFTRDFVTKYSADTDNTINVETGQRIYLEQQQRIVNLIRDAASEQNTDEDKALQELQNLFFAQISEKQYNMGGGFGFEGGSLGNGGAPQGVLDNIYEMYRSGGISPIDKQTLYFAAINCSQSALGAELKIPLQQYLLGGAALMMFDSGFTATQGFLERMQDELGFNARGSLHLFSLQGGKLIPASFLYSTIHKALVQAYQGIVDQFDKPLYQVPSTVNKVTVSNSLSNKDIPAFDAAPVPQNRWDYISKLAQSSVKISFTFLGGMLDIFEAIQNAYYV